MENPRVTQHVIDELHYYGCSTKSAHDQITDATLHGWWAPFTKPYGQIYLGPTDDPCTALRVLKTLEHFVKQGVN